MVCGNNGLTGLNAVRHVVEEHGVGGEHARNPVMEDRLARETVRCLSHVTEMSVKSQVGNYARSENKLMPSMIRREYMLGPSSQAAECICQSNKGRITLMIIYWSYHSTHTGSISYFHSHIHIFEPEGFTPWSSWSVCSTATCRRSNPSAFHFRTRSCIARCNSGSRFEFERCVPDCDGTGGATRTTATSTTSTTTTSTTTTAPGEAMCTWVNLQV